MASLLTFLLAATGLLGLALADAGDYKVVWADEFDGAEGSPADPNTWVLDEGNGENGWQNEDLEYYRNDSSNAALDGQGHLVITAKQTTPEEASQLKCFNGPCLYTSASINSVAPNDFMFGKVDIGVQLPEGGNGTWLTIRILSSDLAEVPWPQHGEINVLNWAGANPQEVVSALYGTGYSENNDISNIYESPDSLSEGFHEFSVQWEVDKVTWLIDGQAYATRTPADLPEGATWFFNDHTFFIAVSMGVGGVIDGNPDEDTPFPQILKLDYVRVSQIPQ